MSKEIVVIEDETKKEVEKQVITLNFDCYEFFKFIDTLSKYVDELEFIFENRELTISFMDASRIMLSKCTMYLVDNLTTIEKMVFGINTEDLKNILKVRKTDLKQVELTFDNTKTFIQIIKTSKKFDSVIMKTLNTLDLNRELIPIENLDKIDYPANAKFNIKFLDDFFYESQIYSEIVEIIIDENIGIGFNEEGQIGKSEYLIKQEFCSEIEVKREEDDNITFEKGSYAYSFLTPIKPLLPILTNSEITFNLKENHPIKLELYIIALNIDMVVYLAPRIEEPDYYDDDDKKLDW